MFNAIRRVRAGVLGVLSLFAACTPRATQPVVYFEIPVRDLDRAERFYRGVFGFAFTRQTIDGNQMALFPGAEAAPGATGALAQGDSYVPSKDGTRVYLHTRELDAALERVKTLGGRILYPKTSLGALGWVAEFEDSEGNRVALHMQP